MRRFVSAAVPLAAALVWLGIAAAAPAAQASAAVPVPARHVVALEPDYRTGGVDWMTLASRFNVDAGPDGWIVRIRWFRWTGQSASGEGKLWISDAVTWTEGHVSFRLYRPVGSVRIGGHRHPYFSRLHITGGRHHGRDIAHSWRWVWAARCWQPG
jgi:hypothetical protein